jgi:DNA-binding transcriptional MerR regulator
MMEQKLSIQETADRTGLSQDTLRYYERIGLINPVQRTSSGHRRYSEGDLAWIAFLNRLRATGMPVRQMQLYAALRRQGDATLPERRQMLETHADEVQARITELTQNWQAIKDKIETYKQMEGETHES